MIDIELSDFELNLGGRLGVVRWLEAARQRLRDKHGAECQDGLSIHFWGACGELAFAKATGVYFDATVNTFKAPDVGSIYVRTRTGHTRELIIRNGEAGTYALVTVDPGEYPFRFRIHGTFEACDVRQEWRKAHGGREPAYFVPQSALSALGPSRALEFAPLPRASLPTNGRRL